MSFNNTILCFENASSILKIYKATLTLDLKNKNNITEITYILHIEYIYSSIKYKLYYFKINPYLKLY